MAVMENNQIGPDDEVSANTVKRGGRDDSTQTGQHSVGTPRSVSSNPVARGGRADYFSTDKNDVGGENDIGYDEVVSDNTVSREGGDQGNISKIREI